MSKQHAKSIATEVEYRSSKLEERILQIVENHTSLNPERKATVTIDLLDVLLRARELALLAKEIEEEL